jgi:SAM-dependent methyltransferase
MGDAWFDVASDSHFWIRRRFQVFERVLKCSGLLPLRGPVAEIGCGSGLVQSQCRDYFGVDVDGFDLNELALRKAVAHGIRSFCYNIHDKRHELRAKYATIILFDVIEHIADVDEFLRSTLWHLAQGGHLVINVPALQSLYSKYDEAAGHVKRYSIAGLEAVGRCHNLNVVTSTYWGMPYLPLLVARKMMVSRMLDTDKVIQKGFRPPSAIGNAMLGLLGQLEYVPQRLAGSSVMAVFQAG